MATSTSPRRGSATSPRSRCSKRDEPRATVDQAFGDEWVAFVAFCGATITPATLAEDSRDVQQLALAALYAWRTARDEVIFLRCFFPRGSCVAQCLRGWGVGVLGRPCGRRRLCARCVRSCAFLDSLRGESSSTAHLLKLFTYTWSLIHRLGGRIDVPTDTGPVRVKSQRVEAERFSPKPL